MSTVLITGGTGALGKLIVERLRSTEHEIRVLSRRPGAGTHVGDLQTGAGVAEAAAGADLIIHAASDFRASGRHDLRQTENLLAAAGEARHLLYVSIVGIDRIPLGYYQRKLACERAIIDSGIPHTILRATQFHELIAFALRTVERWPLAPLPLEFRFQPVAAADVATRAAELIADDPLGRTPDFGGPELFTLAELTEAWRRAYGRPRHTIRLPLPGKVARAYRAGHNTCPDHRDGTQTWAQYLDSAPAAAYRLRG
ncbi:SDR family oxidoreductase [Nocardia cyriacigeorgica]|uniref:SDR family oxidoreductase n=1 Tax=Nocardia cyriacigeorgica TaxID=135487 RepID=UPI0018953EB2|nr:SDR family oxidoreductase [Nocardia cyriacigeorgica]MBF6082482.1 SDR family oxidoreductase [Nocardia cyriacigeorgica]MBF6287697.1 SDR family oxidoreductase [Nocardia cyriacigeorgica]MBF6425428.1 SDR family oxidoreductase [Nocardia cyriacigeorgica]BDU09103.1 nucleotide-diphosphate-sugar epimerase [Nocardia cyriacigeorgica]